MNTRVIDPESSEKRDAPRQFSLRGLLWFVVACSAYFSNVVLFRQGYGEPPSLDWRGALSVIVVWLLLGVFYRKNRLRGAMLVHCLFPATMAVLFGVPRSGKAASR